MNKQALLGQREYFKLVHRVTVRSIAPLRNGSKITLPNQAGLGATV